MKQVKLNIVDIFNIPSAVIYNPDNFRSVENVTIDSRNVKKGSLFIAVKGKNLDGHDFVKQALRNGAGVILIDKRKYNKLYEVDVPVVTVDDTVKALGNIANAWRKKIDSKVIAITGSSGKTSTKEILSTILAEKFKVNKTELNNNNHIGVPLTILSTKAQHDILIAEVGTNHFGEIEYSSGILEPDLAVITNIGQSHTEFLKNKKGVLKEKSALLEKTVERNGKIFLNYDDPLLKNYLSSYPHRITFGFHPDADVSGRIIGYTNDGKPEIKINYQQKSFSKTLPLYGKSNAQNFIAASAIALNFGLSFSQIKNAAEKLKSSKGRVEVNHFKNITIINDTYNANPESVSAAIELTGRIKNRLRKILILGDMFELGKDKIKLHKGLKNIILESKINQVYTIGGSMKFLSDLLPDRKITKQHFNSRTSLKTFLRKIDLDDSVVLVKGSRGMKMEEILELIKDKYLN